MSARIAIIGAGISGLSLAYRLGRLGHEVVVFEAADRPGGPIHTLRRDGYQLETGPHTLLVRHRKVEKFLEELGLVDSSVEADENAHKRYVVRNGEPIALPSSLGEAITTPLLSKVGRLRILAEPFIRGGPKETIDETLASFIARRLGGEFLEYLVDPFVGGIWAGDPHQLSARHAFPTLVEFEKSGGSIALGALKSKLASGGDADTTARRLISFPEGMTELVDRLVERMSAQLHLEHPVRKIRRDDDGWRVIFQRGQARRGQTFDAVVSTIAPEAFAQLEWENAEPPRRAVDELARLPYAPCCVVSLGFRRDAVGHRLDGFGVLIPRVEEFHILGSLFVSSMFSRRAPEGRVLLTAFVGGARQPELCDHDDESLVDMTSHDLARLLDIEGAAEFSHVTRWARAIPQYEVGHQTFLNRLEEIEEKLPNFFFAGSYRDHIGIPNLILESGPHCQKIDQKLS